MSGRVGEEVTIDRTVGWPFWEMAERRVLLKEKHIWSL